MVQVTLSSTTKFINVFGVPVRVWEGETNTGIPVLCSMASIEIAKDYKLPKPESKAEEYPSLLKKTTSHQLSLAL